MLDPQISDILACPQCKEGIVQDKEELICKKCRLAFLIKNGVPILLMEEATKLDELR